MCACVGCICVCKDMVLYVIRVRGVYSVYMCVIYPDFIILAILFQGILSTGTLYCVK